MTAIEAHVETAACRRPDCDWAGFHWHWHDRRFRSSSELGRDERAAFNDELNAQTRLLIAGQAR